MPINLQRYCGDEWEIRDALRAPFRIGACVYATNGHLSVRVPRDEFPDVAEHDRAPRNIEKLFNDAIADTQGATFVPLPVALPRPPCNTCGGDGSMEDEYGELDQCLGCYGMKVEWVHQPIGDSGFNAEYVAWMGELPNATIATRGMTQPALIRFDGGEALLMPMRVKVESKAA